jgi:hypothetical protein
VRLDIGSHLRKLTRYFIAYKRLPGPTTSKTLVSILLSVPSPPHLCVDQSKGEDYVDDNGIRTTVEYTVNEEGKKLKVRRARTHLHSVALL